MKYLEQLSIHANRMLIGIVIMAVVSIICYLFTPFVFYLLIFVMSYMLGTIVSTLYHDLTYNYDPNAE